MAHRERSRPTGIERPFAEHETIVSKTDLKGRITYVNDVFRRVAAYREDELVGQPQNIIRHPDMPAAAFKLLWDELEHDREAFAFIVNLAKDGGHYWVFAHITPSFDERGRKIAYHSARRSVPGRIVEKLQSVYADIRAVERAAGSGPRAAEAGVSAVRDMLAARGLTYQEWIWSIADVYTSGGQRGIPAPGPAPSVRKAA